MVQLIGKNGKQFKKAISYKLEFINSSLSILVHNLAEEIHKIKCEYERDNEKCETRRIKYKDCECFLEYTNITYFCVAIRITKIYLIKVYRRELTI